ncbi:Threonine synthase-like 1 isoform X2 [Aix galericulata]|nr:Threonine synthase-like 1 isoform X2 [Aix galericulata]
MRVLRVIWKSWFSSHSLVGNKNIILMGPPGAGKTTVGRIVGQKLDCPVIDIDDDVLETTWNMSVSEKLQDVGNEQFLEEEGKALLKFSASGSVISLTGSNPMHAASMQHVKQNGIVVYLDVPTAVIMSRLKSMKVDRIVGQGPDTSLKDILQFRKQFYKRWYDVRVLCGGDVAAEVVAEKVLDAVKRYQNSELETYVSTRSSRSGRSTQKDTRKYFSDVVIEGLAPDGGLFVPERGLPKFTAEEWQSLIEATYAERAQMGSYDLRGRKLVPTSSPAVDILKSSNLERYLHLIADGDGQLVTQLYSQLENQGHFQLRKDLLEKLQQDLVAGWCSEDDCLAAIHSVYSTTGYILDTHTAVAKVVADRLQDRTCPIIISSTAHYSKFAPAILRALRIAEIKQNPLSQLHLLSSYSPLPPVHWGLLETLKKNENEHHQPLIKPKCLLMPFTPCSHFPWPSNVDPVSPEAHLPRVSLLKPAVQQHPTNAKCKVSVRHDGERSLKLQRDTFALRRGWGWYQAPGQGSKQCQWEFTAQSRLLSWQGTGSSVSSQTGDHYSRGPELHASSSTNLPSLSEASLPPAESRNEFPERSRGQMLLRAEAARAAVGQHGIDASELSLQYCPAAASIHLMCTKGRPAPEQPPSHPWHEGPPPLIFSLCLMNMGSTNSNPD